MEIKRDLTNLAIRKELMLPKSELKKGFLFVFNKGYTGDEVVFMNRLWVSALYPSLGQDPRFGKVKPSVLRQWNKERGPHVFARLLRVSKQLDVDVPFFRVDIPVAAFYDGGASGLENYAREWFLGKPDQPAPQTSVPNPLTPSALNPQDVVPPNPSNSETPDQETAPAASYSDLPEDVANLINSHETQLRSHFITRQSVLRQATWLNPKAAAELGASFLGVKIESHGFNSVIYLSFSISKAEAQQLTSTPWVSIRNIDLYPLLFNWVLSGWGSKGKPLLSSFPVSSIAKTLPPSHSSPGNRRVDEFGLSIDPEGHPVALPLEVDNTQRYEDLYGQAGTRSDNSYAYSVLGDPNPAKLPANIPVLIDWQNLKFAYSNTSGVLQVLDLSRYHKCQATHAEKLLRSPVTSSLMTRVVSLAQAAATNMSARAYFQDQDLADARAAGTNKPIPEGVRIPVDSDIGAYLGFAIKAYQDYEDQDVVQLSDFSLTGWPLFRPIYRFFKQVCQDVETNIESVYAKYSVAFTISVLGYVTLVARYGEDYQGKTKLEANTQAAAALNQKVDPDWTMPSVPLLSDKIGLLPHQAKVRNLLKDSPDFAILPVQAGGGKTPILLIDVLMEIKANRNQPYLILCPTHLVPQYVKEIVYFTSGKLNVIPITSYATRVNGYARLKAIFEAAPRNTVVVCDYDSLRFRAVNLVYGTTPTTVFPVIEFLRQFRFGYVALDESHYVKNNSARTRAAMMLIADIPKKRLASGTMAHDSPSDLALQVAMLDPTIFGTRDQFNERFGLEVKGDRVVEWKPNAAQEIMAEIKSRVVVAGAMRKEWAALLPNPQEKFLRVDLTSAQLAVYQSILADTLEQIKEAAKTNAKLAKFVAGATNPESSDAKGDSDGDSSESDDEAESESLDALLKPYLARLEQFITAPARDALGDKLLSGEDRMSPKVRMIAQRIREHIEAGLEGKCLVFTNYTASAEEIYDQMPDDLKASGILYRAADKVEAGATFENDARKKWMVGVEYSMNTGLNFQFVSRLLRVETVWNPGTLEQGNARINRPELKKADRRDFIYYDWIVANNTIDVTKISRLISKIVAIAKFENADDGNYQGIQDVPVIKMSLESITQFNSWDTSLMEYFQSYKSFKQVQANDYAHYRERHGDLKLAPIELAPVPEDAALLKRVPYVPGLELYKAADLGLVRIDEYLRMDSADSDDEGEGEGGDDSAEGEDTPDTNGNSDLARAKELLVGQAVHTEYGDGIITGLALSSRRVAVRLNSNYVVRTRLANTFLITRTETSTRDVRNQILKGVGAMPIAVPVDVPATIFKAAKFTRKELREQELQRQRQEKLELEKSKKGGKDKAQLTKKVKKVEEPVLSVELLMSVSNGFLGVTYLGDNEDSSRALEAVGFRPTAPFLYAEVKTSKALVSQFNKWKAAGFTLEKKMASDTAEAFRNLNKLLTSGAARTHRMSYRFSTTSRLTNFFRMELKPNSDPTVIKPYPLLEDGTAFIMLPVRGQAGSLKAIQVKAPGVRWVKSPPSMIYFCPNAAEAELVVARVQKAGVEVANIKDVEKELRRLKKIQFRTDNDLDDEE